LVIVLCNFETVGLARECRLHLDPFKNRYRKDLQQCVERSLQPEPFAHDRNQHVDRNADPDLRLHGVLRRAIEPFDPQVLFDPFEKRRGEPPAIQIRPSNEVLKTPVCQGLTGKLGSTNRTLVSSCGNASPFVPTGTRLDVAQTLPIGQLGERHDLILRGAGQLAHGAIALVASDDPVEPRWCTDSAEVERSSVTSPW